MSRILVCEATGTCVVLEIHRLPSEQSQSSTNLNDQSSHLNTSIKARLRDEFYRIDISQQNNLHHFNHLQAAFDQSETPTLQQMAAAIDMEKENDNLLIGAYILAGNLVDGKVAYIASERGLHRWRFLLNFE